MIKSRLKLHDELVHILGSEHVYFQPPENNKLHYPCIIYDLDRLDNTSADNDIYLQKYNYQIIIVDQDPDSEVVERMIKDKRFNLTRTFISDSLNHFVFTIKYYNEGE